MLTQGQEIGALRREIAALGSRLENVQSGTTKAAAQLSGRLDRFEHAGTDSRALEQLSQRLDTLERRTGDAAALTQAQLQPAAPRDPHALPLPPETTRVAMQPARIPADGYVLRRVRDGAAVVESRAGLREIVPGDNLPGAGRVRAIEKRAGEWVVVTSGGVIDAKAY